MDKREVLDNGIKISGDPEKVEAFKSLGAAARKDQPKEGQEKEQSEELITYVKRELTVVFEAIREEALKKAFKKGTEEEKRAKLAKYEKKLLERLMDEIEKASPSKTLFEEGGIKATIFEFLQKPENLNSVGNKTVEKLITVSISEPREVAGSDVEKEKSDKSSEEKKDRISTVRDGSAHEEKITSENKKLKNFEDRIDRSKKRILMRLEELFKKENLRPRDKEEALRFRKKILVPEKFHLDVSRMDTSKLLEEEKSKFSMYLNEANAEIEQRVRERAADLDEFLLNIAERKKEKRKEKEEEKTGTGAKKIYRTGEKKQVIIEKPILPPEIPVFSSEAEQASVQEASREMEAPISVGESYVGEEIPEEAKREEMVDAEFLETPVSAPKIETAKPEETPEEKKGREKKVQERQDRIDSLKDDVAKARKEYLEIDYSKRKTYKHLWRFFGSDESKRESQLEKDEELAYYRGHYDNKLFELKSLLLEDAKERGISNRELGELVKFFAAEASINMADTHTEVKIEHQGGMMWGKLKDLNMKIVDYYRKLPTNKKMAIGLAFMGASVGAGAIGVGVGAVATATAIRRMFLGTVSGTSMAIGLESRSRAKGERKIEEAGNRLTEGLEGRNDDEKFRIVEKIINETIYDEDKKIDKIKNRNLRQLAAGIGFGWFIGSGTASEIFRGGWHKINEYLQGQGEVSFTEHSKLPETGNGQSDIIRKDIPYHESPVEKAFEKSIELEIRKGGSLEGTILEYLENSGMSAEEAGKKAHTMALEYAKEHGLEKGPYSLIHPGAHIELSPDGTKVVEIYGDDHLGYLPEKEIPPETVSKTGTEEIAGQPSAGTPEKIVEPGESLTGEMPDVTGEYLMDPETAKTLNLFEQKLELIADQIDEVDEKILKISSGSYEDIQDINLNPTPESVLDELRNKKQLLENTREYLEARIYAGHVGSLRKFFSGGDKYAWENIRETRAWDMLDDRKGVAHKFYDRVLEMSSKNLSELKEQISPKREETMDAWVLRISKVMRKLGISKIK